MTEWEDRAQAALDRKNTMQSFGPFAKGILVEGKHGMFVVDPEDSSVSAHLLSGGTYNDEELALASSFVNSSSNALIVGTHIGALAIPLSKLCKTLDAIEANPDTQKLLKVNFLINECNNVTLHCIAASDSREPIQFLKNRDNSGGSKRKPLIDQIYYVYDKPEIVTIDAWPLDERLGDRVYSLILMDIEGSEYFALKGMQKILSHAKALAVEFLPHHLKDVSGVTVKEFCEQLQPHFSWMYIVGNNHLIPATHFQETLQACYDVGQGYDGVYFLKDQPSDQWMKQWGVEIADIG
jgi:FkbM family methyltransferase